MFELRSIHNLTTEEAYSAAVSLGHDLPPLEAALNEDWGRDYVLQILQRHTEDELANIGLMWEKETEF